MRGGKNKKPQGYTIVEVMIVLGISGVMFLIAAIFVLGKQTAVQFTQATNEFNSVIQATIQEVADGQYPSLSTLHCSVSGSTVTITPAGGSGQGYNNDCIFMGKLLSGNDKNYIITSIAGSRLKPGTTSPGTDPLASSPTAIVDGSGGALDNLSPVIDMPNSVPISGFKVVDSLSGLPKTSSTDNIYGIAFLTSPTGFASTSGSGAQTVGLYYITGLTSTTTTSTSSIKSAVPSGLRQAKSAIICLDDGGNRQAALMIGTSSNQLASVVDRSGTVTCS